MESTLIIEKATFRTIDNHYSHLKEGYNLISTKKGEFDLLKLTSGSVKQWLLYRLGYDYPVAGKTSLGADKETLEAQNYVLQSVGLPALEYILGCDELSFYEHLVYDYLITMPLNKILLWGIEEDTWFIEFTYTPFGNFLEFDKLNTNSTLPLDYLKFSKNHVEHVNR